MENLNLLFNKTYYSEVKNTTEFNDAVKKTNGKIEGTIFDKEKDYRKCLIDNSVSFTLQTTYPGLLVGTGYAHGLGLDNVSEDINCGFSFDYVTGQPYIPGSSVKGILRSAFQKVAEKCQDEKENGNEELRNCIAAFCGISEGQVDSLENHIFGDKTADENEGEDVFLDAVIRCGDLNGKILGCDYITPHHKSSVKNPTPIRIIKILPDVVFEFRFVLKDFKIGDNIEVSAAKKLELFSILLQILGVGAKTNVGYGALVPDDSAFRPKVSISKINNDNCSNGDDGSHSKTGVFDERVTCPHCGRSNYKYNKKGMKNRKCYHKECGKDLF